MLSFIVALLIGFIGAGAALSGRPDIGIPLIILAYLLKRSSDRFIRGR